MGSPKLQKDPYFHDKFGDGDPYIHGKYGDGVPIFTDPQIHMTPAGYETNSAAELESSRLSTVVT